MGTYDPTEEDDVPFEVVLAKQRLRSELNLGSRLDDTFGLARSSATRHVADNPEIVEEARREADPEGLLSDADVEDVLEREGIDYDAGGHHG